MASTQKREIFTVGFHDGQWSVEHDGEYLDPTHDKDEAKASANRRAREASDEGRLCQVRISGEAGFFAG